MTEEKVKTVKDILAEVLKSEGLEIAEETAILAAKAIFKSLPAIAAVTENKIDDMFVPIVVMIQGPVLELLDDINKADNVVE